MTTTNNITTSTATINNYTTTYIPTNACYKCHIIKELTEFYKDKTSKDGYRTQCKTFIDNSKKEYVTNNKEKVAIKQKEYRELNKDRLSELYKEYWQLNKNKLTEKHKEYCEKHKDRITEYKQEYAKEYSELHKDKLAEYLKEYYQQNKDKHDEYMKEYYEQNKNKLLEQNKEYRKFNKDELAEKKKVYIKINKDQINQHKKNQLRNNPILRLIKNNRTRIHNALQSNRKATTTIYLLQCNRLFFYNWIYFQLPYKMSDDEFKKLYYINHVKPIASFDLSIEENQFEAFVWMNCCPLLKHKNCSKGAKRNLWLEVLQELKATVF